MTLSPETAMREAIRLSRRGVPAPNPHVGCVVVRDGVVVGRGFHAYAGGPHAEIVALEKAGNLAKDATVYCTLEPCNHQGRTGPCSLALINAGVERVVCSVLDPNPRAGGGAAVLRDHGVKVEVGLLAAEAETANRQFLFSHRRRRPYVVIKAAMGLDGRVALPSGESKWITGEKARIAGRELRAETGCVLIGKGTLLADRPALTSRMRGGHAEPVRVVLDPSGSLRTLKDKLPEGGPIVHVTAPGVGGDVEAPIKRGVFDLGSVLDRLFERGVRGVLVEGGPTTVSAFLRQGLADQIDLFVAPRILGDGPAWATGLDLLGLNEAESWRLERAKRIDDDLHLRFTKL